MKSALGRITKTEPGVGGGLIVGREASFIAKLPPHIAPDRGENVAGRSEATKTRSKLHNRPDARIFAARATGATRASLHASMLARPSLARAGRGRRAYLLRRAYDVARASLYARLGGGRAYHSTRV